MRIVAAMGARVRLLAMLFTASCGTNLPVGNAGAAAGNVTTPAGGPPPPTRLVTMTLAVIGPGTVSAAPHLSCEGTSRCNTAVEVQGDELVLTANPTGTGNRFHHWEGGCSGTDPACHLRITGQTGPDVVAWFGPEGVDPPPHPLVKMQVQLVGSGKGDVTADGYAVTCETQQPALWTNGGCTAELPVFSDVVLHAIPRAGSRFGTWAHGTSGDPDVTVHVQPPNALPYDDDPQAIAEFDSAPANPRYRLEIVDSGHPGRAAGFAGGVLAWNEPGGGALFVRLGTAPESVGDANFEVSGVDSTGGLFGAHRHDGSSASECRLYRDGAFFDVPALPGDDACELVGSNARRHAVGTSWSTSNAGVTHHFFFDGQHSTDLSSIPGMPAGFDPRALSDDDAVGGALPAGGGAAIISQGRMLPVGGGTTAVTFLGPAGFVIGELPSGTDATASFLWNGRQLTVLGMLYPQWIETFAKGVNAQGTVAGTADDQCIGCDNARSRAFVAIHGAMTDLNDLVDTGPWELVEAVGIDDAGRIAGNAWNWRTREFSPFLLTPLSGATN